MSSERFLLFVILASLLHSILGDVLPQYVAREQPMQGPYEPPPLAHGDEELRREHDVAILLSLPLIDANDHPFTIDIRELQTDSLGDTQPRGVARRQNRSMFPAAYAVEAL
jgi:hypothetical protein